MSTVDTLSDWLQNDKDFRTPWFMFDTIMQRDKSMIMTNYILCDVTLSIAETPENRIMKLKAFEMTKLLLSLPQVAGGREIWLNKNRFKNPFIVSMIKKYGLVDTTYYDRNYKPGHFISRI